MIYTVDKNNPSKVRKENDFKAELVSFGDKTSAYNYAIDLLVAELAKHNEDYISFLDTEEKSHLKHVDNINKKITQLENERDK